MIILEIRNSANQGKQIKLQSSLTVGSGPEAQLRAKHPGLLPIHARFFYDNKKPVVEIAEKAAEVLVNGESVMRCELRHQDQVTIGPLRLKVLDQSRITAVAKLEELIAQAELSEGEPLDFVQDDLFYRATRDVTLRHNITFVLPSKDKVIEQAEAFIGRLARWAEMDERKYEGFMTCAKELVLNAHRHGHKYDESKKITIRFVDHGTEVSLVITDQGPGFDHKNIIGALTNKDATQAARERYLAGGIGGLGFTMITKLADKLIYNEPGNQVTVIMRKKQQLAIT